MGLTGVASSPQKLTHQHFTCTLFPLSDPQQGHRRLSKLVLLYLGYTSMFLSSSCTQALTVDVQNSKPAASQPRSHHAGDTYIILL